MLTTEFLSQVLRCVASALLMPDLILLLLLLVLTVVMAGTLMAELLTERRHMRAKLPELMGALEKQERPLEEIIRDSGLLRRQQRALLTVCAQRALTPLKREALAGELVAQERAHYDLRVKITDLIMKLGPMFGLLGTLIPLGPGIIALGQGDTYTLSQSLLTAFDTTVAGLISAAVAMVISSVRKGWYANYMSILETLADCVLEVENDHAARE